MTAAGPYRRLGDDGCPAASTVGRAADLLGATQGFLRAIGEHRHPPLTGPVLSAG
ncbi:hypothetical protein [Streptomyces sp. NPDC012616]|uniref:hypothetical protein n=1 Tax=Streptomyces sp. NPDC012616 TaxID=3364840 RepID=UPI0036E7AC6D